MLLGGDLGRLFSSALALVVAVGLLLVRVKWCRMVAQKEEIKRRMALAWEEAARAEFEAANDYGTVYGSSPLAADAVDEVVVVGGAVGSSPGRQVQYQCEVCFSPTTTRCKRCKSVRYCSGKCQIIHWRQGHKDECHSLSSQQDKDKGIHFSLKEFERHETRSTSNGIGLGIKNNTSPLESSSGERVFTMATHFVASGMNETKVDNSSDRRRTDVRAETLVDAHPSERSSSTILNDMPVASYSNLDDSNRESITTNIKPLLLKQPILPNPDIRFSATSASNQLRSGHLDTTDEQFEGSTSSSGSAACSKENLLSELSAPIHGFWEGTVEPIRTKIDALRDLRDTNMSNRNSSCFSTLDRKNYHTEVFVTDTNKVMEDDRCPAASFPKKLTYGAALEKLTENGLRSTSPSFLNRKTFDDSSVTDTSIGCSSMMASPSSDASHKLNISEVHVLSKKVEICSSNSLAPKQSESEIDGMNFTSTNVKGLKIDSPASSASEAHLSLGSCTRKQAILNGQSVENKCAYRVPAASLDNGDAPQTLGSGAKPSSRKILDQHRAPRVVKHGLLGTGSGIVAKHEVSFPYELFVKLYNWKMVELRPSGLVNCGNSCFANAVLQCLAFTPPLTAYFLQGLHSKACEEKEWCFTCEFEALVRKAKEGFSPLSPGRILSQMKRIGSHLVDGREEDAHDFLRCAIDAMQIVCLKEVAVNVPSSLVEETTLMGLIFGGYLRSKIQCMRCRGKSEQYERIMDLTVEIGGDIGTLEEALRQFTRSEILDGENKYQCGRCNSYEKAKKKLRVSDAPNVLTIALKRFQSGQFGKLNKAVKFPEILNLAPYMSGTSDKSPIYALYGVVVHLDVGNAAFSGHYVCYVKNNQGRWFQADDSTVQVVELEKVLSKGAYMLLYARCSPRAPRVIRSLMVPPKTHGTKPWDVSVDDLNGQIRNDCFYLQSTSSRSFREDIDDEGLSDKSSFFSESGSYSTESSNRDSTSIDDNFDQVLRDTRNCWSRQWRNSSDSDTSSPSSSPSPLHARHSPLADIDRYSSVLETNGSCPINVSSSRDGDGFWTTHNKVEVSRGKERSTLLGPDSHFECSQLGKSSSCRENNSSRLGGNKSRDNAECLYLRTMTGRAV